MANTWTNEFGDRITYVSSSLGKRYMEHTYSVSIDGKYKLSLGSVRLAKSHINKHRNQKCKWLETTE